MGDELSIAIQILEALAVLTLGIGLIFFAVVIRRLLVGMRKMQDSLERISQDPKRRALGELGPWHDICPVGCCLAR